MTRLTGNERVALRNLVEAVEALMLNFDAEALGRIADYVGEESAGTEDAVVDAVALTCLRVIVDNRARER